MPDLAFRCELPADAGEAYAWHARPGALERLLPPWQRVRVVRREGCGVDVGVTVELELRFGPLGRRWLAVHGPADPGREFVDEQVRGPFAHWTHRHRFEPLGETASVLEDRISYRLPLAPLAELVAGGAVRRAIGRTFSFRHRRTREDLMRHAATPFGRPISVAISGASGLIGSALAAFLATGGHRVLRLVRRAPAAPDEVAWDPAAGTVDRTALEGVDAIVHLAGESLAAGRWTAARRRRILASRVDSTRLLATAAAALERPPRALVSASAVGFYGDTGERVADEDSPAGAGFLAEVCAAWEAAADPARIAGIRVVHPRFGVVLASAGGALAKLVPVFRVGAGGPVGTGRQWMSWASLDDALGALLFLIARETLAGPVNVVAPEPVRNREFARTLGRVLGRPALVPVPAAALRLAYGEMAQQTLLASSRVIPARLAAAGFRPLRPGLEEALRGELGH